MRKLDFCICENKDAEQLRDHREADQRLCYTPRKLCLWEGILFSRCPTVCPKRFCVRNILFLNLPQRIIDGISSNFANTFMSMWPILLRKIKG